MSSRPLSLATVMLLIGLATPAQAQNQNLEAGKSPSQIFAGTCNACHKSPRGLLRTVPVGSLAEFLRQHYTTSGDMASKLSGFLVANGAADPRAAGQPVRDAKQEAKPPATPNESDRFGDRLRPGVRQEAAKPDASSPTEVGHNGRNYRRLARPEEQPDANKPAEGERAPEGQGLKPLTQRLSKRGKRPVEESGNAAKREVSTESPREDPAKPEPLNGDQQKDETAKAGSGGPDDAKTSDEPKSEAAKVETGKDGSGEETAEQPTDPVSAARPSAAPEPASPPAPTLAPPAAVVSMPTPVAPAGPPAPPISQ